MGKLVYSTDQGKHCPECSKPSAACICKSQSNTIASADGVVRIRRETKGRKGNGVSIIEGTGLNEKEAKLLAKHLKQAVGAGGSVKNGLIEIQSDQRDKIKAALEKKGFTVKIAGG